MSDTTPAQAATPEPQAGEGQQEQEQANKQTTEELRDELKKKNSEARNLRDRLKEAEGKLTAAEKAQADEAAKLAAEQGRYQELYEKEQAKAAELESQLNQMRHDQLRRDAAQAAGIPQLWQRLQGSTPEELAEDAKTLATMMQPAQPANGQPGRTATTAPTPAPQGPQKLTDEERRARAVRTF
jgi:hypothetical protein